MAFLAAQPLNSGTKSELIPHKNVLGHRSCGREEMGSIPMPHSHATCSLNLH